MLTTAAAGTPAEREEKVLQKFFKSLCSLVIHKMAPTELSLQGILSKCESYLLSELQQEVCCDDPDHGRKLHSCTSFFVYSMGDFCHSNHIKHNI